uniref:AIPP2-like SPOC-like domain-containing protein n=1 Tax=Setaria viridis TaxID=4556 RepID=A0A4U6U1P4_SETVI|nr:hypothetical protein SEVIR_7G307000v2 [Setaria viridis]
MENQRQPSGSFGPKLRMSTKSKAANRSMRRRPRFNSKRMNNIVKDMERRKAYMPNMRKMNARSGVGVKDNAHMHSGKKPCGSDKKDQDGINRIAEVNILPQKDSRAGQSSDVLPLKNGASKSKQSLSHISKNARQSPTSRLDNDLIPLMDIKSSHPLRVENVLPSIRSKELENPTPFHSKDGSNATKDGSNTNLGLRKQSHSGTSHHVDVELMAKSAHQARNADLELMAKSAHQARNVDLELMAKSTHQARNVYASSSDDDTLGPKSNGGQESNVRKDSKEISRPLKCKRVSRGSNIPFASETLKASCKDKNCAIVSSKDVAQSEFTKTCLHKKDQPSGYVGKNNDVNSKRKKVEGKLTTCDNDDYTRVVQQDNLTCGTIKRRRCMAPNEVGDEVGGCNKNLMGVDSTIRLTPQEALLKKQQCNYCSKPICEPSWKGIFKIDGKEYISLAGHLSTKSCEKVWELSKSLPPVVEVERVSRLVAWPSVWKASKPSSDNIGLYFLHENMRNDEELDQLVKEVVENDLLLRAVVNEAEMLIFPSVLLPKRYQTFQAKYYLWAVFNPREDKGDVLAEPLNGTGHRAQATCLKPAI